MSISCRLAYALLVPADDAGSDRDCLRAQIQRNRLLYPDPKSWTGGHSVVQTEWIPSAPFQPATFSGNFLKILLFINESSLKINFLLRSFPGGQPRGSSLASPFQCHRFAEGVKPRFLGIISNIFTLYRIVL